MLSVVQNRLSVMDNSSPVVQSKLPILDSLFSSKRTGCP